MLACTRPVAVLGAGGSYGNLQCFVRTDSASNLNGAWCARDSRWYAGNIHFGLFHGAETLPPVRTTFLPFGQRTRFQGGGVRADLTVLVPPGEATAVLWLLQVRGGAPAAADLRVEVDVRLAPQISTGHIRQPGPEETNLPLETFRLGPLTLSTPLPGSGHFQPGGRDPSSARAFGASVAPDAWVPAGNGRVRLTYALGDGRTALAFALTFGPEGARRVTAEQERWVAGVARAIAAARAAWAASERTTRVLTPSRSLNRAVAWAKSDCTRLMHRYPVGAGFTNDPPGDIVVARDAYWMAAASTYLDPAWTRDMHRFLRDRGVYPGGKVAEYVCGADGRREDYGLDINDATPLFLLSLARHHHVHQDAQELHDGYPTVRAAARWILGRMREGLVFCSAEDTNAFGIASWRNIIPGETITGAVTEINALCAAALREAADLAREAGDAATEAACRQGAAEIAGAIAEKAWSEDAQWYHLSRDADGTAREARSADAVFPVLCGVGDPAHHRTVLAGLLGPGFRSPRGIRTVSREDPGFDAEFGVGLVGGVWPNLTLWVARAAAETHPAEAVALLEDVAALVEPRRPRDLGNAVPGEFPEWFGGEALGSRGMTLSPWAPPTVVWMAVEGLGGLRPTSDAPGIEPCLAPGWNWLAVAGVPYRGGRLTWFVHNGVLYCTHAVRSALPVVVLPEDVSRRVRAHGADVVALAGRGRTVVLVAAQRPVNTEVVVPSDLAGGRGRQRIPLALGQGEARLLSWAGQPEPEAGGEGAGRDA